METQKIINLLNDSCNQQSSYATKNWYVIESDAYIPVMGDIKVVTVNNNTINNVQNTDFAFKSCAPFSNCKTHSNDVSVDDAKGIYIIMPMYNLIIILIHQEVYGSLKEMKYQQIMVMQVKLVLNNLYITQIL